MARAKKHEYSQYLNPDFLAGRATGTCCWGCAKRNDCPGSSWPEMYERPCHVRRVFMVG